MKSLQNPKSSKITHPPNLHTFIVPLVSNIFPRQTNTITTGGSKELEKLIETQYCMIKYISGPIQ